MLKNGSYVRMKIPPKTRMGTLSSETNENGRQRFLFQLDQRFRKSLPDFYVSASDVEECPRPTEAQIDALNKFLATN